VRIDLLAGTGQWNHAQGDTLVSIERVIGSAFNDLISGTAGGDVLEGGAGDDGLAGRGGDDVLIGGAGADTLDGGAGFDTADYSGSNGGVRVDLLAGTGLGAHAQGDTLANIERVVGSSFRDILSGSVGNDVLIGGAGDDALAGRGGDDVLIGGAGNDTLIGGAGNDRFVFMDGAVAEFDVITDFQGGLGLGDVIDLTSVAALNSFLQVQAAATQVAADTVIAMGGGSTLTLQNVLAASLVADDFVF